jgi:hypothetical protein
MTALRKLADDQIAKGTTDAYFLGLVSASMYNLNMTKEAQIYADAIVKNQMP